jgi:hypothetical protein
VDFIDWLSRSLLGSTQDELRSEATIEEAERLQGELLLAVDGWDDDEWFPVRLFMIGVAEQQGGCVVDEVELAALPDWATIGWFREAVRSNMAELARGAL